ncbi:NUDIX hydrolase [Fodinibacter luteus]|uniref:NUDIX hydrolase n=1 Tax=Fodinibacter luteus TaxID=552064 RepID=A0ABP8KQW5_9MICO
MIASFPRVSAGVLPWRLGCDDNPEVLLVHRRKQQDWAIAKGNTQPGESARACAVRELREETGISCQLSWALPSLHYLTRSGEAKTAHFWAATPTSHTFRSDSEVDAVRWLGLAEAALTLTKPRERAVPLALAARLHSELGVPSGPRLRPVLLVRGASATPRERWAHHDATRPLTAEGERVARSLAGLASLFEVDRVLSAPSRRCVDAVVPLAERQSLSVEVSPRLTDDSPLEALDVIERARGTGSVVCTHEDVISAVLRHLMDRDRIRLHPGVGSRRGSVWVLTGDEHRYTAAHYLPMPESVAAVARQATTSVRPTRSSWGAA